MKKGLNIIVTLGWRQYQLSNASIEVIEALQRIKTVDTGYLNGKTYLYPCVQQDQIAIAVASHFVEVEREEWDRLYEAEQKEIAERRQAKAELAEIEGP